MRELTKNEIEQVGGGNRFDRYRRAIQRAIRRKQWSTVSALQREMRRIFG